MGPLTDLPLGIFGVNLLSSSYNGFNEVIKSDFKGSKIRQELKPIFWLSGKNIRHITAAAVAGLGLKSHAPKFHRAVRNPPSPLLASRGQAPIVTSHGSAIESVACN